jgi:hypothetical protein
VRSRRLLTTAAALALVTACSKHHDGAVVDRHAARVPGKQCVVHLHGKSGEGAPDSVEGGVTHLRPGGNASGWGGRQWLYFPDDRYTEVRSIVGLTLSNGGCDRAVVHGFSNGAAAAAKLFCRGETFDARVVGYVIDDPVVDHGADQCRPASGVMVRLYWTTALAQAVDGWFCAGADWTCEGSTTIGVEQYAARLRTTITPSPHTTHAPFDAPPEYAAWLATSPPSPK